jgi:hypothetical protein
MNSVDLAILGQIVHLGGVEHRVEPAHEHGAGLPLVVIFGCE